MAYTHWEWHKPIFDRAKAHGMLAFSSPFNTMAVDFLKSLNVPRYKIASFKNTDHILLKKVAQTGKPVIMSTGVASITDIQESVEVLRKYGCKDLVLLKCTRPTLLHPKVQLLTIPHMKDLFDCQIGLSDHSNGLHTRYYEEILGKTATQSIEAGTAFSWELVR